MKTFNTIKRKVRAEHFRKELARSSPYWMMIIILSLLLLITTSGGRGSTGEG